MNDLSGLAARETVHRQPTAQDQIAATCDGIKAMLLAKNRKYGNSALEPVRIFSRSTPVDQILVRLDDKLSRLRSAQLDEDEDVIDDLIGYLVLLKIARTKLITTIWQTNTYNAHWIRGHRCESNRS